MCPDASQPMQLYYDCGQTAVYSCKNFTGYYCMQMNQIFECPTQKSQYVPTQYVCNADANSGLMMVDMLYGTFQDCQGSNPSQPCSGMQTCVDIDVATYTCIPEVQQPNLCFSSLHC